jgi:hypothetical protein
MMTLKSNRNIVYSSKWMGHKALHLLYLTHKLTQKCRGHKPLNLWPGCLNQWHHGYRGRNKTVLLFRWAWTRYKCTPQGECLFIVLLLLYFCFITYKVDGQVPIIWKDAEEMLLLGTLPSQIHKELGGLLLRL